MIQIGWRGFTRTPRDGLIQFKDANGRRREHVCELSETVMKNKLRLTLLGQAAR
mgnify:FL=1